MRTGLQRLAARGRRGIGTAVRTAGALIDSVWRAPRGAVPVPVIGGRAAPVLDPGQIVSVLVWNIQFCAGRSRQFFYDGGPAVHVAPAEAEAHLDRIGEVIATQDADFVVLQEVDRGSDRTQRTDQHAEILARAPYPCHASTAYFDNRYVPHPPDDPLGRVEMHLSVLSRYRVATGTRWPLPALSEPWLRRQFNLRRALLQLDLPLSDGRTLSLFNAHLSAFSGGDGTLPRQIGAVRDRLVAAGPDRPQVLAGDFNALPPVDDPARLGAAAEHYAADIDAMQVLFDRFRSVVPLEAHRDEPERWRTWLPHGAERPERALDHAFVTDAVEVLDASVLSGISDASDHLPIRIEIAVGA